MLVFVCLYVYIAHTPFQWTLQSHPLSTLSSPWSIAFLGVNSQTSLIPSTRTRDKKKNLIVTFVVLVPSLFFLLLYISIHNHTRMPHEMWIQSGLASCHCWERRAGRITATRVEMISWDGLNRIKVDCLGKEKQNQWVSPQMLNYHIWTTSYLVVCICLVNVLWQSYALMLVTKGKGRDSCSHLTLQSAWEVSHFMLFFPVLLSKNVSLCAFESWCDWAQDTLWESAPRWRTEIIMELSQVQKPHPTRGCSLCWSNTRCIISARLRSLPGQAEKTPYHLIIVLLV